MKNIWLVLFAFFTLASCTAIGSVGKVGSKQASITNTQWTVTESVSGPKPTLLIEEQKIAGNAGCNSYFGAVVLNPSVGGFSTSGLGSTRKACEDMTTETNFLGLLQSVNHYVVNGNTLELYKDNLLLMKFTRN